MYVEERRSLCCVLYCVLCCAVLCVLQTRPKTQVFPLLLPQVRGDLAPVFESILSYTEGLDNVLPPAELDCAAPVWAVAEAVLEDQAAEGGAGARAGAGAREGEEDGVGDGAELAELGERRLLDAVVACNVCHISPFAVTEGLMAGAARYLAPGGGLFVYGPFIVEGVRVILRRIL